MIPESVPLLLLLALSQAVFLGVSASLAIGLLRLANRTGEQPERLLGLHFGLCLFLGYILLVTGVAAVQRPGTLSPGWMMFCIGGGQVLSAAGVFANVVFTWRVFRPGERWAAAFAAALGVAMVVGIALFGVGGGFERGRFEGFGFWMYYGAMMLAAVWVAAEAFRYRTLMRRREAIGLGDPLLSNRFLLWGIGSLARFGMLLCGVAEPIVQPMPAEPRAILTVLVLTTASTLGLVLAASYWLAFLPTQGYVRWVTGDEAGIVAD